MAIEHQKQSQPVQPPPATLTLTKNDLEQRLWSAYRLGCANGLKKAQPVQVLTPTCPVHVAVPLWSEEHPTKDGSWLYCPFCRQDALKRDTGALALKQVQPQTIREKARYNAEKRFQTRLVSPNDDWLNSDISKTETRATPVVKLPEEDGTK